MIIGFSHYGQGRSGPALGYLTGYLVNGGTRNVKPDVVRGDPKVVSEIIDALPFQNRYSSGVLSFAPEDHVTPEIQEEIMNRFENTVFAGLDPDRRSIVWIKHGDKGRTELHFVVPRVDLGTRKSLNIAPPTPASRQLLDTLRESVNVRYGFRDPSDPACAQAVSVPGYVAKLAAQAKRHGRSAKTDIRRAITEQLHSQVLAGTVKSRVDVTRFLKDQGFNITREGVNYLTIQQPDSNERMRLKGNIFRRHFCPEDLQPALIRHDPAKLVTLDRRLERLMENRADYHRARYRIEPEIPSPLTQTEELLHDRTRNSTTHIGSTAGEIPSRPRAEVWGNALRLNEAAQRFRDAGDGLERARQRIDEADRALARETSETMIEAERGEVAGDRMPVFVLPKRDFGEALEMEMDLEL